MRQRQLQHKVPRDTRKHVPAPTSTRADLFGGLHGLNGLQLPGQWGQLRHLYALPVSRYTVS